MAEGGADATKSSGTVTILFTDLVSSTQLLDALGDEEFERLRRIHFRLLREAVAQSGGQEVKNLGDGLMVVFPSALDAIGCAVAMQQAVAVYNAEPEIAPIAVRVGLHAGEPIVEDDDYFGTPVVIAKRLCDQADGGQILVSDLVAALVGGRRQFSFRDVGSMELKGLGNPLPTREVVWREGDLAAHEVDAATGSVRPMVVAPGVPGGAGVPPVPEPALPATPAAPGIPTAPTPPGRRNPWMYVAAGLAMVLLLGAAVMALGAGEDEGGDASPTSSPAPGGRPLIGNRPRTTRPSGGARPRDLVVPQSLDDLPEGTRTFAQGRDGDGDDYVLAGGGRLRDDIDRGSFPIDLYEGEVMSIAAVPLDGEEVSPLIELFDPVGAVVAFDLFGETDGVSTIRRYHVPVSGAYEIRVTAMLEQTGKFGIVARGEPTEGSLDEADPWRSVVQLDRMRATQTLQIQLDHDGQVLFWLQSHPYEWIDLALRVESEDGEVLLDVTGDEAMSHHDLQLEEGVTYTAQVRNISTDGTGLASVTMWEPGGAYLTPVEG